MQTRKTRILLASLWLGGAAAVPQVTFGWDEDWTQARPPHWHAQGASFQRVSTLANYLNNDAADIGETTVSEIVAATRDGQTLVYTDSPRNQIGLVDITDPANPLPIGVLGVGGEPTSVEVLGNTYALVAVNTSTDFVNTSGELVVIDIATRSIVHSIDLGGQPDSAKISPDGAYLAIAIENERDEELCVGGSASGIPVPEDDDDAAAACEDGGGEIGVLPQTAGSAADTNGNLNNPPGYLVIVDIVGMNPADWVRRDVDLTGLAAYAPEDPEPEFVDVNADNQAVVTLQENNHIAIVDLVTGSLVHHFDVGTVTLNGVDNDEDGIISLTDTVADVPREPDAVTWLRSGLHGPYLIATANEGDLFGGSRGFSLFKPNGKLQFDSGASLEEIAVRHGHYPEDRSENKGTEPEAIEYARFGHHDFLFVASERGSFVAVYEVDGARPRFKQLLPAPLGPEGLLAIPSRNLLIASGEEDDPPFGVRSSIMIYQLERSAPTYPQIVSDRVDGSPIPWSALSGMVALPGHRDSLLAVWDSYYSESRIFRIDASEKPAVITGAMTIQGGSGNYDPEGIAIAPDHTLWIASEGNASDSRPNRLLQTDLDGTVIREVGLPQEILDCRKAERDLGVDANGDPIGRIGTHGSGFEGVAVLRAGGDRKAHREDRYKLLVAQQRGWDYTTVGCEELDDDAGGLNANGEPNWTRIWIYDPQSDSWDQVAWELAPKPADASWVGLSEITAAPDGSYVVLERDNRTGDFAALKTLVRVRGQTAVDGLISHDEKSVYDMIPDLEANNGWITDKPEGVAITSEGRTFVVTDNDGVEDWSGESWFLDLGRFRHLFR